MENDKEKIDTLIRETLNNEEAKFYDELEEKNLLGKLGQAHKGKMGWLVTIMTVLTFLIFLLFVYCAVQFFNSQGANKQMVWLAGGLLSMFMISMLKLYIWMQMDKNDILRELKRLELQVAAMAHKLDK